jgi:hypothetical protein
VQEIVFGNCDPVLVAASTEKPGKQANPILTTWMSTDVEVLCVEDEEGNDVWELLALLGSRFPFLRGSLTRQSLH